MGVDIDNRQARRDLTRLRWALDNMRGVANDNLVDRVMRKGGGMFTRNIMRQIRKKGWSKFAAKQVETRKMKQRYRKTYRAGTYTYVILYDTPKGSKKAPYMRFQDWGTSNQRKKTLWHDVEGKNYREWEEVSVKHKGIPPQHFSRKAWRSQHRRAERTMLNGFASALRKMAATQRKINFGKLEARRWGE